MVEESKVGTKLVGFYRGKVKKHCDFGRCKIYWPGVSPALYEIYPDKLPEAEQAAPLFAASNNIDGLFFYPGLETTVWGFFEDGDVNRPVYFASTLDFEANKGTYFHNTFGEKGNRREAMLMLGPLCIKFNDGTNCIKISGYGSSISLSKDGIKIESAKDIEIEGRNVSVNSTMKTDINGGAHLDLRSANVLANTGEFIPGRINMTSNNNFIATTGGNTMIVGDLESSMIS